MDRHIIQFGESKFEIGIQKIGFHTLSFDLTRIRSDNNFSLIRLFKELSLVIIDKMKSDPRIQRICLLFLPNRDISNIDQWRKICVYYIEKNFKNYLVCRSNGFILEIDRINF